ncbi:MAG: YdcF family protein [Kiritimatiellae bacterium]|nr:YdcF family protein [Kiritimatiellia bacterium]MBR0057210.1 YdcF family protein [Kiritimatiellia bacterium]
MQIEGANFGERQATAELVREQVPNRGGKKGLWRVLLRWGVVAAVGTAAALLACNWAIGRAAAGRITAAGEAVNAPEMRAALVLGCARTLLDGSPNVFFSTRIRAAAALWQAGKVSAFIVSGDNHRRDYDEPSEMKAALVAAGVPEDRIVCDYAGFRTLDSVVRAKTVFGLNRLLIVSQPFHLRRAIFLARSHGIDAYGYAAADIQARWALWTLLREQPARLLAVIDVLIRRQPHFGGAPVPLPGDEDTSSSTRPPATCFPRRVQRV